MGSSKNQVNQKTNQQSSQSTNQSSSDQYNQSQGAQSSINFKQASPMEQQLLSQIRGLGNDQTAFLQNLMSGQTSPYALNAQDQGQLDASYKGAMDRFSLEGKDYADYLATTRGLNKSDDPVSQQAMQRYGLGMADLLSQKANQGLNMGFQGTGMRMQGASIVPAGLGMGFQSLYNERLAAPTTTQTSSASGSSTNKFTGSQIGNMNGTSNTMQRYTPSIMSQIGQGMGLAQQGLALAAGIGSMGMGMPGLGGMGMGSGAAANSGFSNMAHKGWN